MGGLGGGTRIFVQKKRTKKGRKYHQNHKGKGANGKKGGNEEKTKGISRIIEE